MKTIRLSFRGFAAASLAVFCLSQLGLTSVAFADTPIVCEGLIKTVADATGRDGQPGKDEMSRTQIERLQALLESLPQDRRDALLKQLGQLDFDKLKRELSAGASPLDQLAGSDITALFLMDFIALNDGFPGIFQQANPAAAVFKVLDLGRKIELGDKLNHPDLLASIGQTSRFHGSLNSSMANLIQQAEADYLGMRFPEQPSGWGRAWYRIKRFVFPLHNRVRDTIDWVQEIQRQLQRVRMVDQLIVRLALSEAQSLKLSNEQVDRLLQFVVNSPAEIADIEKLVQTVVGSGLAVGRSKETGTFDIHAIGGRIAEFDRGALLAKFDKINLDSLDELDAVLSEARKRQGNDRDRDESDYLPEELQIRFEAGVRGLFHQKDLYEVVTAEDSNDRYEVEESYTVTVPDGTDEKGNPKTKTETRYRWIWVTPSFEDILSGDFEKGDTSSQRGLTAVIERAEAMVGRERKFRKLVAAVEAHIADTREHWVERRMKGKNTKAMQKTEELLARVREMQPALTEYAAATRTQIERQYELDNVENFKQRNARMVERFENAKESLEQLRESIKRDLPRLEPAYSLYGFDQWLLRLRSYRNQNYAIKTGMGLLTAGGASLFHPDVQLFLYRHGIDLQHYVDQVSRLLP